jgi:hypothetical protein
MLIQREESIDLSSSLNLKHKGIQANCSFLMMKISNTERFIKKYKEKSYQYLNKINMVFHSQGIIHQGDIFKAKDTIIWMDDKSTFKNSYKNYLNHIGT